jgi:hypothetical protein
MCLWGVAASGGALAQGAAPAFTPADEKPENLPDGPGREETFYACTACHNFKLVAAQGMTRAQWDDSLTWMTTRHNMADIQGADRDLILNYLEKHSTHRGRHRGRAGGRTHFWLDDLSGAGSEQLTHMEARLPTVGLSADYSRFEGSHVRTRADLAAVQPCVLSSAELS